MATLSQSQLMMYAAAAGLPNPPLMAAIAMGESSGRTDVVNSIGCVGPWQINQPVWVKTYPQWTVDWLKDPMNNATAAKVVYDAQGLSAWQAYTNGAYLKYYNASAISGGSGVQNASWWHDLLFGPPGAKSPLQMFGGPSADTLAQGAVTTVTGVGQIADRVGAASAWIANPHNWLRVAYVGAGVLLVLVAAGKLAAPTVTSMAKAATPVGRAVSIAGKAGKAK